MVWDYRICIYVCVYISMYMLPQQNLPALYPKGMAEIAKSPRGNRPSPQDELGWMDGMGS